MRLIVGYEVISKLITDRAITILPEPKPMQFSRLDMEVDKSAVAQVALPRFILERRAGVSFQQERYCTVAPMHTKDHLAVLEQIEKIAAAAPHM